MVKVKLHQPGTEPFEVPETVPNPVIRPRRERPEPPAPEPARPKREPERKPEPVDARLNEKGSRHVRDPLFMYLLVLFVELLHCTHEPSS